MYVHDNVYTAIIARRSYMYLAILKDIFENA